MATSKLEKEKQKLIQDKCQQILTELLRDDDNKFCVDCDAKGRFWLFRFLTAQGTDFLSPFRS